MNNRELHRELFDRISSFIKYSRYISKVPFTIHKNREVFKFQFKPSDKDRFMDIVLKRDRIYRFFWKYNISIDWQSLKIGFIQKRRLFNKVKKSTNRMWSENNMKRLSYLIQELDKIGFIKD